MRQILKKFSMLFIFVAAIGCSENKSSKAGSNFPVKPLIIPGDNGDDWGMVTLRYRLQI